MDTKIKEQAKYWATSSAFDEATNKEVSALLAENNEKELTNRFYRDLEFGTGGMRGIMGAGTAMMNIYNIRKASTALSLYLLEVHPDKKDMKIAISHDSRNRGREFAKASAEVFAAYGIKTLITKEMRPVPMLSFMTRHFNCQAGVCVTASHNPPVYNGYKVYWETGGQLVPPHDQNIISYYKAITDYDGLKTMPYNDALNEGLVEEVGEELDSAYFDKLASLKANDVGRANFKVAYSPIHGTGIYAVPEALKRFGFNHIDIVPEQEKPDGNFPTVKSPNPEDPSALTMALELAKAKGSDLVLATDPDCDRIAFVANEGGEFAWFNGNQMGCLLVDYVLSSKKENGSIPDSPIVIKTIVTTELQNKIAHYYGVDCVDTLTGFKWICNEIESYETGKIKPYKKFVCGGEESYGFLAGDFVRDKDAAISCAIATEMAAWHKSQGRTLTDALNGIFTRHGVYQESLHTLTMEGKEGADHIKAIMETFRNEPPKEIAGVLVKEIHDVKTSLIKNLDGGDYKETGKLSLPTSNVLQFFLVDGSKVSVRPSGTEPKIKFYISVNINELGKKGKDLEALKTQALARVKEIEESFIKLAN